MHIAVYSVVLGVVASQDVEKVFPDAVAPGEDGYLGVEAMSNVSDEIDRELIGIFEYRRGAAERLAKLGPAAFDRVFHLYHSTDIPPRLSELGGQLGRECVDLWAYAISTVARANPGKYLDWLTGREPSTLDLVILGTVDDPRASTVLRAALDHPEWLHRHHAEESLARRGERP